MNNIIKIKDRLRNLNKEVQELKFKDSSEELCNLITNRFLAKILETPRINDRFFYIANYRKKILESPETTTKVTEALNLLKGTLLKIKDKIGTSKMKLAYIKNGNGWANLKMSDLEIKKNIKHLLSERADGFIYKILTFEENIENSANFDEILKKEPGYGYKTEVPLLNELQRRYDFVKSIINGLREIDKKLFDEINDHFCQNYQSLIKELEESLINEAFKLKALSFENLHYIYENVKNKTFFYYLLFKQRESAFNDIKKQVNDVVEELIDYIDLEGADLFDKNAIFQAENDGALEKDDIKIDKYIYLRRKQGEKNYLLISDSANDSFKKLQISPTEGWLIERTQKRLKQKNTKFKPATVIEEYKGSKGKHLSTRTIQNSTSKVNRLCEKHGVVKIFVTLPDGYYDFNTLLDCMNNNAPSLKSSPVKQ